MVDRKNDRYRERITTPDGEVVRDVDEPLSEHRGLPTTSLLSGFD